MRDDATRWGAFLQTVSVRGALPVEFSLTPPGRDHDGRAVAITMFAPHVGTEPPPANAKRIPLGFAEGIVVPFVRVMPLPPWTNDEDAAIFVRDQVRAFYRHEADEQIRIGDARPFIPHHEH